MSQWLKEISAPGLLKQKFVYRVVLQIKPGRSLPWWPQYLPSPPPLPHFGFIAELLWSSLLVRSLCEWKRADGDSSWDGKYSKCNKRSSLQEKLQHQLHCWSRTLPHTRITSIFIQFLICILLLRHPWLFWCMNIILNGNSCKNNWVLSALWIKPQNWVRRYRAFENNPTVESDSHWLRSKRFRCHIILMTCGSDLWERNSRESAVLQTIFGCARKVSDPDFKPVMSSEDGWTRHLYF